MGKRVEALRQVYYDQGATEEQAELALKTTMEGASAALLDSLEELGHALWDVRWDLAAWASMALAIVLIFAAYAEGSLILLFFSVCAGALALIIILGAHEGC